MAAVVIFSFLAALAAQILCTPNLTPGAHQSSKTSFSRTIPSGAGWHTLPDTKLANVCIHEPLLNAVEGCSAIIADWNSGIADTKRNRLVFWGGGHAGYAGNEVYALDLSTSTLVRLTQPSLPPVKCAAALTNPRGPNSRHTYNGLAYLADTDELYVFGGAAYRGNDICQPSPDPDFVGYGGRLSDTWTLDLVGLTWRRRDPTAGHARPARGFPNLGEGTVADYDPVTKKVYIGDTVSWFTFDSPTNKYVEVNHRAPFSYLMSGAIDPERRLFVLFGGAQVRAFDIRRNVLLNWDNETKGCAPIQNTSYPGVAYDPLRKRFVLWAGGNSVYIFDSSSKQCHAVAYADGPGEQQRNGTLGRFRYFPALEIFALVNDWKEDAYTLRLAPDDK